MLVRRGVVDRVRLPGAHDFAHAVFVPHRCQQRHQRAHACHLVTHQLLQLLMHGIERELAQLHQQQFAWARLDDLAAQLAPDGAASTGHQHHLAANVLVQQLGVGRHGVAPQQVFDVQLAQIAHLHLALRQIHQARQRAHRHLGAQRQLQDLVAPLTAHRRNGQQHIAHVELLHPG